MGAWSSITLPGSNPYIGPRPFQKEDAPGFFGRDNEARDLLSLVVSEQLVLFYAQSGAGKSSLINTRLVPGLEEKGFEVLPVGRVSGAVLSGAETNNVFVYNLLTGLDASKQSAERFQKMRLAEFLSKFASNGNYYIYDDSPQGQAQELAPKSDEPEYEVWPRALIIDQFEEIVTTHPEAWEKRKDFFLQLAEAMKEDPYLWVVLVMREDFVATLDPYAHLLPGQMRARFYMRRMGYESALEAVRKPVASLRPYAPGVAEMLVDNLRLITGAQSVSSVETVQGEYVEPVQLQVVCYQLWKNLLAQSRSSAPASQITQEDIQQLAKGENLTQFVSNALAEFYEKAIAQVLAQPNMVTPERELRDWFSHKLITESETRGLLFRGKDTTAGLSNLSVDVLGLQYIIRSETRSGGIWVELVHDRFVGPILQANRRWASAHQRPSLLAAKTWQDSGQQAVHLYDGNQLGAVQGALDANPGEFTELERQFVEASLKAAKGRRDRYIGIALGIAAVLLVAFTLLTAWALYSAEQARAQSAANVSARATLEVKSTSLVLAVTSQVESVGRLATRIVEQEQSISTMQAVMVIQSTATPTPPPDSTAVLLPSATPTPRYTTFSIGKSAGGRDIMVSRIGSGPRHIVVVGGLAAGFAPASVNMVLMLNQTFTDKPDLVPAIITLDIILNANPDSQANGIQSGQPAGRLNANGVDLNRNWDCYWNANAVFRSASINPGSEAFSEPESRVLRDFIIKSFSQAAIFYGARSDKQVVPGGCGEVSVFSQPLANLYAKASGYTAAPFVAYDVSGDATNWLDSQGVASVYVLLPDYDALTNSDMQANLNSIQTILNTYGR